MTEITEPNRPPEDEESHDMDASLYGDMSLRADTYFIENYYNKAMIHKIKAALMANTPDEKQKCSLDIAKIYLKMSEKYIEKDATTTEEYLSKAEEWLEISVRHKSNINPMVQKAMSNTIGFSKDDDTVYENLVDHMQVQLDEFFSGARYSVGQTVMFCFMPGLEWHMTEGEKAYEEATISTVGLDNNGFLSYKLHVPSYPSPVLVSAQELADMQKLVNTLRDVGR